MMIDPEDKRPTWEEVMPQLEEIEITPPEETEVPMITPEDLAELLKPRRNRPQA